MYLLDHIKLKKGDIILSRRDDPTSVLVRRMSASEYSHACLYVGAQSSIDSDGFGVQSENTQRIQFEKETDALVLRYYRPLSEEVIDTIVIQARRKIGTEYSISEAKKSIKPDNFIAEEPNRQFCTRFVAQAYFEAGYAIVINSNYCTPADLVNSNVLVEVKNPLKVANATDMEIANQVETLTGLQMEVTNYLFQKVRNLTKSDLQTFEQVGAYLINSPENDSAIVHILHESGYTTMYQLHRIVSPHFYDLNTMITSIPDPKERRAFAENRIEDELEIRKRFRITLDTCKIGYDRYGLGYFKTLMDLQKTLLDESLFRETVLRAAKRS